MEIPVKELTISIAMIIMVITWAIWMIKTINNKQ